MPLVTSEKARRFTGRETNGKAFRGPSKAGNETQNDFNFLVSNEDAGRNDKDD